MLSADMGYVRRGPQEGDRGVARVEDGGETGNRRWWG
jgi:hypothetical protein